MRKVIYSKYSNQRDQKFSIRTDIVLENGMKYVQKTPQTKEAAAHLENLYSSYLKLKEIFADSNVSVNQCQKYKGGLAFEYLDGQTMEELLDDYLASGKIQDLKIVLEEFGKLIVGRHNSQVFQKSLEFKKVFGEVELPEGLVCGEVSNIDMISSNMILNKEGAHVIDYEWTFAFPIPANFILYRCIYYYMYTSSHRLVLEKEDLFGLMGISKEEIPVYQKMEESFQNYIRGNHKYLNLLYQEMGKKAWSAEGEINKENHRNNLKAIRVYEDYGHGVGEQSSYIIEEVQKNVHSQSFEVDIRGGVKVLRIDPASCRCIMKLQFLEYEGCKETPVEYRTNGHKIGEDNYIFYTEDPQIIIKNIPKEAKKLMVELSLDIFEQDSLGQVSKIDRAIAVVEEFGITGFTKKAVGRYKHKYLVRRQQQRNLLIEKKKEEKLLLSEKEMAFQKETQFKDPLLFSIICPVYNTRAEHLREMIESVQMQTYSNWELCIADGSDPEHSYVGELCQELAQNEDRIRYKKLEKNLGISENSNACMYMAKGDYFVLLDHDDVLHPGALFENRKRIEETGAEFLYSDEVTFQEEPVRSFILYHFKPDFSIDNLRSNNYICHLTVFSRKLLMTTPGFRKEFDGSQDHDLVLRLTSLANKVEHIAKVLYFWRAHENSVAAGIETKEYAAEAGIKVIETSLQEAGIKAEVEASEISPSIYRIHYDIVNNPLVSIIIPNKEHLDDLKRCVNSILTLSTYENYEIIIIDNNSQDDAIFDYYAHLLKENNNIRVIPWNNPFNYSAINNFAVDYAKGDYLIFLNNDTKVIASSWMEEMLMYVQREDVGAAGAKLVYENGTIQHAGVILGLGEDGVAGHSHIGHDRKSPGYMGRLYYAQDVSAVTAACMMIKKSLFLELEGFNEDFEVAYNDVDLSMRIREKGYLIVFTPYAELYHYESASRGLEDTPEKKERFTKEVKRMKELWGNQLESGDPFYNPNLSLKSPWVYAPEE